MMYSIKPTYQDFNIDLPKCMYQVKVMNFTSEVHNNFDTTLNTCSEFDNLNSSIQNLIKKSNNMELLEARQENLLHQLKTFKSRLLEVRKKLTSKLPTTTTSTSTPSKMSQNSANDDDIFDKSPQFDIVINAHPKYVPYGLLAIKNAWKNVNLLIKIFSHSTLPDVGAEAKHFQNLLATDLEQLNNNLPTIKISLIWKNCEHTEMISSPTMYKPIYGEINILRFLARIGPINYRYDNQSNATYIDAILDICYQLLRITNQNAQNKLLINLSERLNEQKYFGGNNCSIADIAVASTIKRLPQAVVKNLPNNLQSWHKIIKNIVQL